MPTKAKDTTAPVVEPVVVDVPITSATRSGDLPAKTATIDQVIAHSDNYIKNSIKYHNQQ